MDDATAAALARAKERLDRLDLYPEPVRIERVRVVVCPLLFRLPRLRRFDGYALPRTILLRRPVGAGTSDDLLTHELVHVWQIQAKPLRVLAAWLRHRYRDNPYEREARLAAAATSEAAPAPARAAGVRGGAAPRGRPPARRARGRSGS